MDSVPGSSWSASWRRQTTMLMRCSWFSSSFYLFLLEIFFSPLAFEVKPIALCLVCSGFHTETPQTAWLSHGSFPHRFASPEQCLAGRVSGRGSLPGLQIPTCSRHPQGVEREREREPASTLGHLQIRTLIPSDPGFTPTISSYLQQ